MTERNTSVETRESPGKVLKKEREARNLSLKEVAKHTKISEQVLAAIEEDQVDLLPSATYVKGFLSAYARFLGIDPSDVVLRYQSRCEVKPVLRPEAPVEEKIPPKARNRRILWGVLGMILICFILLYFALPLSPPPPQPQISVRPVAEEKPAVLSPQPTGTVSRKEEAPCFLQLKATEETWIRIHINDQPGKEMILKPGETASHEASDRIRLLVGNAGGLNLIYNGKALDKVGKSGEVVTLIFTPRGVETKPQEKPKPPSE
jgi:transcriptional regulator with XRE-family HTH domain